jgi:hypothetical protein
MTSCIPNKIPNGAEVIVAAAADYDLPVVRMGWTLSAMPRSAGVDGISVDRAADLRDA